MLPSPRNQTDDSSHTSAIVYLSLFVPTVANNIEHKLMHRLRRSYQHSRSLLYCTLKMAIDGSPFGVTRYEKMRSSYVFYD